MTYDFRRRLRSPLPEDRRPPVAVSDDVFSAWFEAYSGSVLGTAEDDWLNVSNAFGRIIVSALVDSGALWMPEKRSECCDPVSTPPCPHLSRGPDASVSGLKLLSHEGWFVAPDEARHLADHLDAIVAARPIVAVEVVAAAYDADLADADIPLVVLEYDFAQPIHLQLLEGLRDFARFCLRSSDYGFEVW